VIYITNDMLGAPQSYSEPWQPVEGLEVTVDGWLNGLYALYWLPASGALKAIATPTVIAIKGIGPRIERYQLPGGGPISIYDGFTSHVFYVDEENKQRSKDLLFRRATKAEWEEAMLPLYYREERG